MVLRDKALNDQSAQEGEREAMTEVGEIKRVHKILKAWKVSLPLPLSHGQTVRQHKHHKRYLSLISSSVHSFDSDTLNHQFYLILIKVLYYDILKEEEVINWSTYQSTSYVSCSHSQAVPK